MTSVSLLDILGEELEDVRRDVDGVTLRLDPHVPLPSGGRRGEPRINVVVGGRRVEGEGYDILPLYHPFTLLLPSLVLPVHVHFDLAVPTELLVGGG